LLKAQEWAPARSWDVSYLIRTQEHSQEWLCHKNRETTCEGI